MIEIAKDVVFVKGAKNGAIYDFNSKKVYSVNEEGCSNIEFYFSNNSFRNEYISLLVNNQLINYAYTPKDFLLPSCEQEIPLEVAWLELTQLCNLRCLHCYEGNVHQRMCKPISLEHWKQVIHDLVFLHVKRVIVIGGEPCCSPYLEEVLLFLSQYKLDVTLFTNATLLDENLLDIILKLKIRVKVSIYGHCADVHDKITMVNGSFLKLVNATEYLIKNGIDVSASVVIMRENQEYLKEILDFVQKQGLRCSRCDVIRNVYGGTQCNHFPTKREVIDLAYFSKPNFKTDRFTFLHNSVCNSCWAGKVVVSENGDVFPCEFERNIVYGNVCKQSLVEIVRTSVQLNKCWHWDYSKIEFCRECEYRFACRDCRPLGLSINNSLKTKNPRCTYNPQTGIWGDPPYVD